MQPPKPLKPQAAYDNVLAADADQDDAVRNLFNAGEQHDRSNPTAPAPPTLFPDGGFGDLIDEPLAQEPESVSALATRVEALGAQHPLAAHAATLRTAAQDVRDALKAQNDAVRAQKSAEAEEEIAQAALRRQYEPTTSTPAANGAAPLPSASSHASTPAKPKTMAVIPPRKTARNTRDNHPNVAKAAPLRGKRQKAVLKAIPPPGNGLFHIVTAPPPLQTRQRGPHCRFPHGGATQRAFRRSFPHGGNASPASSSAFPHGGVPNA